MKIDFIESTQKTIHIDNINDSNIIVAYDPKGNHLGNLKPCMLIKENTVNAYRWRTMNQEIAFGLTIKEAILKLKQLHPEYEFEVY